MNKKEIIKVLAVEFGSQDVLELNKALKARLSENIKFNILGKSLGYLGFTVVIKNITDEGLKIFDVGRVRLIKYDDIERFQRAKVKIPRVKRPKKDLKIATKAELNNVPKATVTKTAFSMRPKVISGKKQE